MTTPRERIPVGILGATGLVGQRLLRALEGHPWFRIAALAASSRSTGRTYGEATRWVLPGSIPSAAATLEVRPCEPGALEGCRVVVSSLGSDVARGVEGAFADAGFAVVSNSSAFRQDPDVPLVIPEVNPDHLGAIAAQRSSGRPGFVVTNPNCSVTGLALVLAPLHRAFGVRRVVVTTLQAVSGAGLEGPSGLDMLDNVLPYIAGEEDKIERELVKILGQRDGDSSIRPASIAVAAHCHRVGTLDGHLEAVSVELERTVTPEEAVATLRGFRGAVADLRLPSSPVAPIEVRTEPDRPQPRLDRDAGGGMTAVVGRVRPCPVFSLRLELLSHNTIRGAAGAALLNLELLAARGELPAE